MRNLGQELAIAWGLPNELQQALSVHFADSGTGLAMTLSTLVAREIARDWHGEGLTGLLEHWSAIAKTPLDQATSTIHQLSAAAARQLHGSQLPQPAFFMLFPETAKPLEPEQKPDISSRPVSLQQTLTLQMKNMQKLAGVERVLFALLTPDRKNLKVRFILGGNKADAIRRFTAELTGKNLFSLLMQKPQAVCITQENQAKYLPLIPKTERTSLITDNLMAMSLFVKNKPVGLFIADNATANFSNEQYQFFKQCCNNAARALEAGQSPEQS
jgi:hypothetical protein